MIARPCSLRFAAVVAACCLPFSGCQRIGEVSGTVRVDGKPAKGLVVIFDPQEKEAPRGVATTGGDGRYTIRRLGPGSKKGVPVGAYGVRVTADMDDPNAIRIPDSYARSSGLTCEVASGGENTFDIEIKTK
ncbi:MAG: carboxypeptidase-like regulatory domain-containing protein [Pirellulales bacterium]